MNIPLPGGKNSFNIINNNFFLFGMFFLELDLTEVNLDTNINNKHCVSRDIDND